ncbi:efflux RND transporter periplasmic adaptor subunit [Sandaracinobacter sp. RS1-74]|uniref:efflux RND transporter periplasmic adaptor subunit n=1 Tax=Sandaracinobacteroides sayramensis TaxID=2913411 RepID=UPI001EDC8B79|nr:efflux RND transporter periplasmic adaptor subunit [Sandaracinobacteroides sayramensis]MCG2841454.1 efflux RND transporter periplasmic adaptor subunit [Sandaracinobacteroides sayramensis]
MVSFWRGKIVAAAFVPLLLAGCAQEQPPAMPPPQVEVVVVRTEPIANVIELPGRVQAVRTAEVRARVTGIVGELLFREGSDVRAGQPLFSIDPRELQASLAAVQATLQRAEAGAANARQDVERYRPLLKDQAISKQEYDTAVARLNTAEADVLQARAQVASARLNLGYSTVTAPISGRTGRALVTEGALVSAGEGTLLTVIEQVSPVYVNFSQASSDVLAIRRDIQSGKLHLPSLQRVQVELELEDGSRFSQSGRIDFLAPTLDESTGSVALRAEFPNPGGLLLPGQFVRARIFAGTRNDAILVPQRAVNVGPQGGIVIVVNAENLAEARPVGLGDLRGENWVVTGGLKPGDRVITAGLQKVQPGQPVQVVESAPAPGGPTAPDPAPQGAAPAAKAK